MTVTDEIRQKVKEKMAELELTQYLLEKEHGVSQAAVSRFLSGKRYAIPTEIQKLFDVLGLKLTLKEDT